MPTRPCIRHLLALLATAAFLVVPGAVQAEPAFVLTIDGHGHASIAGPPGMATLREEVPGASYAFDLNLGEPYTTAAVDVLGGVTVDRPRQLVPEVDDSAQHPDAVHLHPHYFAVVRRDVGDVDRPAHILNITQDGSTFTFHLGLIGPGTSVFTLRRDVEAPFYQLDEPTEIVHNGFLMTTRTDEFAFGTLRVWPATAGEAAPADAVMHPTPSPALRQTFPVVGLDPETDYRFDVVFEDWAGNSVTGDVGTVRTLAAPVVEAPVIVSVDPVRNGTVAPGGRIAATFRSPTPVQADGIGFFLDKVPTPGPFRVEGVVGASDEYTLVHEGGAPMDAGRHEARFEATNTAGATTGVTWTFFVADHAAAPEVPFGWLCAAAFALALLRRQA